MNLTDELQRKQFDAALAELFGALGRKLDGDAKGGLEKGLAKMPIVDFTRSCERIIADLEHEDPPRNLSARTIWAARERLRASARPAPPMPEIPPTPEERWNHARASRVGRHLCAHFARYMHPSDLPVRTGGTMTVERLRQPNWRPHPVSDELSEPIYEAGRRWAAEMRLQTHALGRAPRPDSQDEVWQLLLIEAEAAVDAIRALHEMAHPAAPKGAAAARFSRVLNQLATPEAA